MYWTESSPSPNSHETDRGPGPVVGKVSTAKLGAACDSDATMEVTTGGASLGGTLRVDAHAIALAAPRATVVAALCFTGPLLAQRVTRWRRFGSAHRLVSRA